VLKSDLETGTNTRPEKKLAHGWVFRAL
jgi:hypothetical protein